MRSVGDFREVQHAHAQTHRRGSGDAGTFRGAAIIEMPLYDAPRNTAGGTSAQLNNALYSNMAICGIVVENHGNYRLNGARPSST